MIRVYKYRRSPRSNSILIEINKKEIKKSLISQGGYKLSSGGGLASEPPQIAFIANVHHEVYLFRRKHQHISFDYNNTF